MLVCRDGEHDDWDGPAKTDLDPTDAEFHQGTEHLTTSDLVGRAANRDLDEQRIVVRL
jgi:hypothetical protein